MANARDDGPRGKTSPLPSDQRPIYFTFGFHWDSPVRRDRGGPVRESVAIRRTTDLLERHAIRAHYGFVGAVAQQLAEDDPDTVAKIRKLKIAVGYHGGAGHNPRGPHGMQPDTRGLSPDETIRALWTFETRALYPDDHPQAGQPMPNVPGGWLAIQMALGVTPLQTDASGRGSLFEALGAGYPMSVGEVPPHVEDTLSGKRGLPGAASLPGLHEIHVYGEHGGGGGVPPTYYGWPVGEFSPVTVDIREWFRILAENVPRDRPYVTGFMSHAGIDWAAFERLVQFLEGRTDFRITAPDPGGWQWNAENSPLVFYRKRYGVKSLEEVMSLAPPLEAIRQGFAPPDFEAGRRQGSRQIEGGKTPKRGEVVSSRAARPASLVRADLLLAADYVLSHWPSYTHDGDFGGPPRFVWLDQTRTLSLADAFEALVRAIEAHRRAGVLPESVGLHRLRGPIDFPTYRLDVPQSLDYRQRLRGYTPREIPREALPDPRVVASQGLPACGDYHLWIPTHTKADAADVIAAVKRVAETMTDHVPGAIRLQVLCHTRRGQPEVKAEVAVNPAEFLYVLAQEYRALAKHGKPNDVVLVSMKVAPEQTCRLLLPQGGNRFEGFVYRGYLGPDALDAAWTRAGGE